MSQEITLIRTEDHYEMRFEGNDTAYPVPEHAIDTLDDEVATQLEDTGDSVTFVGEYGGHKHMKNFDVAEIVDGSDDQDGEADEKTSEEADAETDEPAPVDERFEVGDCVENPSQRGGQEYEVVDIREKQTFNGIETVFAVKRVSRHGNLKGTEDVIHEKDHENWEAVR